MSPRRQFFWNGWTSWRPGLGLRLIAFNRLRLLSAFAGIGVAVTVMFVEFGLLMGILNSQSLMATLVAGDLVVVSEARTNLHKWDNMNRIRLNQIAAVPGVADVIPVYQGNMGLRDPETNSVRRILVVAFPPEDLPFTIGSREEISRALRTTDTILFDRLSRPIYPDVVASGSAELNGENYRVAGYVDFGPDIIHDGAVVMSDASWLRRYPNGRPIMGVIRVTEGANIEAVRERLAATLPDDVSFFTPAELRQREFDFTLRSAPIGILFGIGMLAGLVIGAITCYQILFNEIVDRIKQYATLKAMGFSDLFLKSVILEQAVLLACGGFLGGLVLAAIGYVYIAGRTQLAVTLTLPAMVLVFVLAAGMSVVAALLALRRVTAADPAELY